MPTGPARTRYLPGISHGKPLGGAGGVASHCCVSLKRSCLSETSSHQTDSTANHPSHLSPNRVLRRNALGTRRYSAVSEQIGLMLGGQARSVCG